MSRLTGDVSPGTYVVNPGTLSSTDVTSRNVGDGRHTVLFRGRVGHNASMSLRKTSLGGVSLAAVGCLAASALIALGSAPANGAGSVFVSTTNWAYARSSSPIPATCCLENTEGPTAVNHNFGGISGTSNDEHSHDYVSQADLSDQGAVYSTAHWGDHQHAGRQRPAEQEHPELRLLPPGHQLQGHHRQPLLRVRSFERHRDRRLHLRHGPEHQDHGHRRPQRVRGALQRQPRPGAACGQRPTSTPGCRRATRRRFLPATTPWR